MGFDFDAIAIGSGLGGLTAAAMYARAGNRVLVLERNTEIGGCATTFRHGDLTIEASLHETARFSDPVDPKLRILTTLGIIDDIEFVPAGPFYEPGAVVLRHQAGRLDGGDDRRGRPEFPRLRLRGDKSGDGHGCNDAALSEHSWRCRLRLRADIAEEHLGCLEPLRRSHAGGDAAVGSIAASIRSHVED